MTERVFDGRTCRILVVDDEADVLLGLRRLAESLGAEVRPACTAEEALAIAAEWTPHLIVSDITMPGLSGLDLLGEIRREHPETAVVLVTGFGTIEMAVTAMQRGAAHFITKPFDNEEVIDAMRRFGRQALLTEGMRAACARDRSGSEANIVSRDPRMEGVLERITQVAPTRMNVLVQGESGTGKELIARAIHQRSGSSQKPFLAVSAAALPDALLESELFGHVRGAFTGALRDRKGLFEQAAGGTVLLDEVGLMSTSFQGKLLRVLQERVVTPLGGTQLVPVDFRLIAASAQPLEQRVRDGSFRQDLYYRLNVVSIEVPPLRERPEDVLALATHFVAKYVDQVPALAGRALRFSTSALDVLRRYAWPGNVRELENCIQRALVSVTDGEIRPEHLGLSHTSDPGGAGAVPELPYEEAKQTAVRTFQRRYLERALSEAGGNVTLAAQACGMTRAALQRIMRSLGIDRTAFRD